MSDPTPVLLPAIVAALAADAGVISAMSGKAKIYDVAPTGARKPYCIVYAPDILPTLAEGMDLADAHASVDIWSLTEPPGQVEAATIGAAVEACLMAGIAVAGFRLSPQRVGVQHLVDPSDSKTAHSIVKVRFAADPL